MKKLAEELCEGQSLSLYKPCRLVFVVMELSGQVSQCIIGQRSEIT